MISRRLILSSLIAVACSPSWARNEYMTEAERRAERTAIAERRHVSAPRAAAAAPMESEQSNLSFAQRPNIHVGEAPGTIVVRTGERELDFLLDDGTMLVYPIAVGRDGAQWFGTTTVTHKRKNPEWRPTPNMRRRDPSLPEVVRPGPGNPMGVRSIYLAQGYLRIHGTNAPQSIGKAVSSGCYRMFNEDVIDLYERTRSGAKVIVLR